MKLGIAGMFLAFVGCNIPSVGDINIDGCMDGCTADNDVCLQGVHNRADFCQSIQDGDNTATARQDCFFATGDYVHDTPVLDMENACWETDGRCIEQCFKDVEAQLGKKQ